MSGCVYCGFPCARSRRGRLTARTLVSCVAHADLLALDPVYNLAGQLAAIAYPALALDRAPSARRREGPAFSPTAPLATAHAVAATSAGGSA